MTKDFTRRDVYRGENGFLYVRASAEDLIDGVAMSAAEKARHDAAQREGGYGRNVPSLRCIMFEGRIRRLRYTCFSNVASHWFADGGGRTVYVS